MSTNLIISQTSQEFLSGYTPVYSPIYPLFTQNGQQYAMQAAERTLRRAVALGDIRTKRYSPKDTEVKHFNAGAQDKVFKAYMNVVRFTHSVFQDASGVPDILSQALEEHQKAQDELLFFGDGATDGTQINNGLYFSNDANYVKESSSSLSATNQLLLFHQAVVTEARAVSVGGPRMIMFYGDTCLAALDSLHADGGGAVVAQLEEVLGNEFSLVRSPKGLTPAGENGILVINQAQVKTHYVTEPVILDQDTDRKEMQAWANFVQGSMMVDVAAYGGIRKLPLVFLS